MSIKFFYETKGLVNYIIRVQNAQKQVKAYMKTYNLLINILMLSLMQVKHCKVDHQSLLIDLKCKESWSSKASDFQTKGPPRRCNFVPWNKGQFLQRCLECCKGFQQCLISRIARAAWERTATCSHDVFEGVFGSNAQWRKVASLGLP